MAKETALELFLGTDHLFEFEVLNEAETAAVNAAGWDLSWMVKRRKSHLDAAAVVTKATGGGGIAVTGAYSPDPALNTQLVVVTVTDADTEALNDGTYHHELKLVTPGFETVLAYGELALVRGVHRA